MLEKDLYVKNNLDRIKSSIERILENAKVVDTFQYYYNSPAGMERLESTCMLLIAIGESLKGIDKLTDKQLLVQYPEIDWKGAMGIRDIIAHHYFELDAEIVFNVVKTKLPDMLEIIRRIIIELDA